MRRRAGHESQSSDAAASASVLKPAAHGSTRAHPDSDGPASHAPAPYGGEGELGYGDVARIAEAAARCGMDFVHAHTIEPYSRSWVLCLRAAKGTLYRVDSWAGWRALLGACKAEESSR